MGRFMILGHGGRPPASGDDAKAAMARWMAWFEEAGDAIIDTGAPFAARRTIGDVAIPAAANGYMILRATDLDAATELAATSPAVAEAQGLEIIELVQMPDKA